MKRCPVCKTTYTDDSLRYCLSDGASLEAVADEETTFVRRVNGEQFRVDIGGIAGPTEVLPKTAALNNGDVEKALNTSVLPKVIVGAVVLLVCLVVGIGVLGLVMYLRTVNPVEGPGIVGSSPSPSPSEVRDPEKERLREEIANIRRRLDEKERSNSRVIDEVDDPELDALVVAKVNSPNDGFLALRSQPSIQTGERLARIPHRAAVEVLNCNDAVTVVEGRRGRWCEIDYEGQVGWVFDAWLEF